MKKLRKNSRQSLILLLLFLGVNFTYSQSDSLIKSEFKKLLIISKLEATIKLEIVDSGITKSYRTENERKIVFSKTQFGILSQSEDKKYDIHILRFLLAHEIAHQVQFDKYTKEIENNESLIFRMLLEAQADILAGSYFFNLLMDEILNNTSNVKTEEIAGLYKTVLEIGISENSIGTHPTKKDRFAAFINGALQGSLESIVNSAKIKLKENPSTEKNPFLTEEAIDNLMRIYQVKLFDFNNKKEDELAWSYKIAKRIINFNPEIAKHILLVDKRKNGNLFLDRPFFIYPPYFEYDLEYLNISSRKIYVEFEVYTYREDSLSYQMKVNTKVYKDTLNPTEKINIKGRLRWDKYSIDELSFSPLNENDGVGIMYPSYIQNSAWIACKYVDEEENYGSSNANNTYWKVAPEIKDYDIANSFLILLRKLKYSKDDLYLGVGDYIFYENKTLIPKVKYKCPIDFDENASVSTIFLLPKSKDPYDINFTTDDCLLEINYKPSNNKNLLLKKIKEIEKMIDATLFNKDEKEQSKSNSYIKQKESDFRESISPYEDIIYYYSSKDDIFINLFMDKMENKNMWRIRIIIRKM